MEKGLCEICNPKQWKTISADMLTETGYPVYGANGIIGYYTNYNHEQPTILITCRGATCGTLNICEPFSYVNGNAMALDNLSEKINIQYLYYYLLSRGLSDVITGSAQPQIVRQSLEKVKVTYPPLDKQRKIAAVLDKVSDLIAKRRQQLDKMDELVKSRFIEMFGNFVYDRDRWQICEVGDVADTIDPQPSHRTPPVSSDGVPYVGIAECNYKTCLIDFEKARKVGQNVLQEHTERYTLDEGDFIIGKIGTIGKPFFVPAEQTYTLSANTVLIKPIKEKVAPQYLFAVFQSEYMDRIIDAEKKSTSQPAFGIQKVRRIEIPMPPLVLQKQFATFVAQTDQSKLAIQKSLDKLETLKKALMQEYFGRGGICENS